jgi:tetratricopeptide (TPR) repeat protein
LLARNAQSNSPPEALAAGKEFAAELELDPTNARAAYELAEEHRNLGRMDEAERLYRMAVKYYPEFDQANLGLAAVLLKQGKPEAARGYVQKAIATDAANDMAWYRLVQVERALGDISEEQKVFAGFQRLRQESSKQDTNVVFSSDKVTRQKAD